MDIVLYTEFIVKSLCKEKDLVSVKEISFENNVKTILILVKDSDMGLVVGKNGKNIKSLRTLVEAYAYLHDKEKIILNIEAF